jgi:serpin B
MHPKQESCIEIPQLISVSLGLEYIDQAEVNGGFAYLVRMLNRNSDSVKISLANSMWIRKGFEVLESFKQTNRDYFSAAIEELDFSNPEARDIINGWVKENTNGLIESIIDQDIDPMTVMFLINTIYFKGDWKVEFNPDKTYEADFKKEGGGTSKVDMMSVKKDTLYYEKDGLKMISLPYGEGGAVMDMILPEEGLSMEKFTKQFGYGEYIDAVKGLNQKTDVQVGLPKFKVEYETSLNDVLIAMGMEDAFTGRCDLSGINDKQDLFISDVRHKTYIDVNEEGTEAAGVTSVGIMLTGVMDPITFIADRPFSYIIRDAETDTILFMGIYDTP